MMGLHFPDSVNTIVAIGANTHPSGLRGFIEKFRKLDAAAFEKGEPHGVGIYKRVSPDGPGHFPVVYGKIRGMFTTQPDLRPKDLAKISAPVLVMAGDDDVVALPHTVALFKSLSRAQLFVAPGASHMLPLEKPALVNGIIRDFIAAPPAVPKDKAQKGLFNE